MKKLSLKKSILLPAIFLCSLAGVKAQHYFNAPISQYYRNGFLWNPAYAGSKDHPFVYALFKQSWLGFEGAPSLAVITGDMPFGKNSAAGFSFSSDKSGLLQRTMFSADYSFNMEFSNTEHLRLGISLGGYTERVNNDGISDPGIISYNDKGLGFDGNIGAVYEKDQFSFGAAFYNLKTWFSQGYGADVPRMQLMAAYTFIPASNEKIAIKPMIAYQAFSASSALFNIGGQFEYDKLFNVSLIWQSSGSLAGSLGLSLPKIGEASFSYATNNKYGYGQQWELGIGVTIF